MTYDQAQLDRYRLAVRNALGCPTLYKVEWEEAKSAMNRLIEQEKGEWSEQHREELNKVWGKYDGFYYGTPYANQLPGYVAKIRKQLAKPGWAKDAPLLDLLKRLTAIEEMCRDLMALKDRAQSGRRPSADPRKTPERTLDNTGTCGICGKNIKRDDAGVLVDHGFKVGYGQREGHCFGVKSEPWEQSPAIVDRYVDEILKPYRRHRKATLKALQDDKLDQIVSSYRYAPGSRFPGTLTVGRDNPMFDQIRREETSYYESEVRQVESEIERRCKELKWWQPKPLPGEAK